MVDELTPTQKALVEQIILEPATFNTAWAHMPSQFYWRTNNFIQRGMSHLFGLDTTQTPSKWIPLEVDSAGRLEVSSIAGAVTNQIQGYDGAVWRNVSTDGNGRLRVNVVDALPAGTNNIGDVDIITSALPTGAATEATLATLNGKVTACNTGAVVLAAGTATVGNVQTRVSSTGSAPAAVAVGVASALAVAANASRKGLVLTNTSANTISLAFGANAAVLNSGITLLANGGTWVMDSFTFSAEAINAIAGAAASNLAVQELT